MRVMLFALLWLLIPGQAAADELRPGYIELTQQDAALWRLVWKAPMRGGVTPATQPILPKGCTALAPPQREMATMAVISRSTLRCEGAIGGKQIGLSNFSASITDVLVRVAPLKGSIQTLRLTADEPVATIAERPGRWQVAWSYLVIGIEHILFGFDHLLFVLALVLLLRRGWDVAKAVTAFTVAHSITLAGTTLGWMGLAQRPVEAVIALSIIFLAVEIVKARPDQQRLSQRLPWLVAFLFGLLHGFGFAGALREVGLPEGEVPMALFTFNVGVEAGQLVIVMSALGILALIARFAARAMKPVMQAAAYGIGILSSYWLFERILL